MSGNKLEDSSPSGSSPLAPPSHGSSRRWIELAGLAVAVVGVLVAIFAWVIPVEGDDGATGSDGQTTRPSGPPTVPTASTSPPTPSPTGTGPPARYLTELVPVSGGGYVRRVGAHSLIMNCGSGESDDRDREVAYDVPPSGYRSFRATARPTGQRETRVRVTVLVTGVVAANPVLVAGSSGELAAELDGPARLILRVTCDPGAASATFVDPALYR